MLDLQELYTVNSQQLEKLIVAFVKSYGELTEEVLRALVEEAIQDYREAKLKISLWELVMEGDLLVKKDENGSFIFRYDDNSI